MTIYVLIFLVQALLCVLCLKNEKRANFYMVISFAFLFFISSFRASHIGTDYAEYVSIYEYIIDNGTYWMEPGYVLLNKIAAFIIPHYCGLAIFVNLVFLIPLFFFIRKHVAKKYWLLCIFIFAINPYMYVQSSFNILRQACATGLIIIATHFALEKKTVRSILFVLLAFSFHKIAIVGLIIPFFLRIKLSRGVWYVAITGSFACATLLGNTIISLFSSLMGYEGYASYEASLLNNPLYCIFIFVVALFFAYCRDKCVETKAQRMIYDLYLLSLCILFFGVKNDMIYRVYIIFAIASLPAIPIVWKKCGSICRLGYVGYYTVFFFGYIAMLALSQNLCYVPFKFCFG